MGELHKHFRVSVKEMRVNGLIKIKKMLIVKAFSILKKKYIYTEVKVCHKMCHH